MKATHSYEITFLAESEVVEKDFGRGFAEFSTETVETEETETVQAKSLWHALKSITEDAPAGVKVSFVKASRNGGPTHHIGG